MKGYFITFEGGDGSGKSSHARLLADRLERDGYSVLLTREPGDTAIGATIRSLIIEQSMQHRTELFLFLADRAEHVETVIAPALAKGQIVICDRFSGSTIAYQIGGRQIKNSDLVMQMDEYARDGIVPDETVYLDVPEEVGQKRRLQDTTQESNHFDKEQIDFYQRVRHSFLEQAQREQWIVIDTQGEKEENHEKIYAAIKRKLEDAKIGV